MKKFHKTFGWVEVTNTKRDSYEVRLENGDEKEIKKDFLFDDENCKGKKTKKQTEKDLRAIAHTMSADAVKEHIEEKIG